MSSPSLEDLYQKLGYRFSRPGLIEEALTHPSADHHTNYERLEFLGDRVLALVVADWLVRLYPAEHEGDLAARFNDLVRREQLAEVSQDLGLGHHMRIGKGETQALREKSSALADVCEAVIAALYLDGGEDAASAFIHVQWVNAIEAQTAPPKDAKSELQEWAMSRALPLPEYHEVKRQGPDHALIFTMEVAVEGQVPVSGTGPSKKIAESVAASVLMRRLLVAE